METTIKTNKELQEKINALIEAKRVDKTTIARGVNVSPATISLYLSNKYAGRIDTLEESLEKYLKTFENADNTDIKSLKFIETQISKRIFNAANMCHIKGKMGVCFGEPGIGKTTAIKEYSKQMSGVIVVDPFEQSSARAVLKQIANHLKLNYHNNMSLDEFTANVVERLARNKFLIIIDEAENIKIEVFKIIRKIHDRTKGTCGILFVGTYELYGLLQKVKNGFPYISSRIGYLEKLDALKLQDAKALINQYFPNVKDNLIKEFARLANYNARAVQNMLDLCLSITQSENIELNIDVIETAREKLLI